jgi:hypothetical protein
MFKLKEKVSTEKTYAEDEISVDENIKRNLEIKKNIVT